MNQDAPAPILQQGVRWFLRSGLRGRGRLVSLLARAARRLQCVPVQIRSCQDVYVDLRYASSQGLFAGSPWETSPAESGEQVLMAHIVREGERVFDIGANIGLHTIWLSRLVGPRGLVFAFEPNPKLLRCLHQTVAGLSNVRLFPFALSDATGKTEFYLPKDHSLGSLADWTRGRVKEKAERLTCEQRTVDELVQRQILTVPEFIKCDVEGAELKVFRGARETFNRKPAPIILFESNVYTSAGFGISNTDARAFLASLPHPQYEFFSIIETGELTDLTTPHVHANLLAVPRSKMSRIEELRRP
jgi:FkbM family methyltransferase